MIKFSDGIHIVMGIVGFGHQLGEFSAGHKKDLPVQDEDGRLTPISTILEKDFYQKQSARLKIISIMSIMGFPYCEIWPCEDSKRLKRGFNSSKTKQTVKLTSRLWPGVKNRVPLPSWVRKPASS